MTWEELVAEVTARHPLRRRQSRHLRVPTGSVEPTPAHESKMFRMPCLKRENGKVVAGHWKDGGLTVKLTDAAQREAALEAGAGPFDPAPMPAKPASERSSRLRPAYAGMGRVMKEWVLVPESLSDEWLRLVEQAI